MPKLSETTKATRRRHVLESAWRCFTQQGFHATSMDDIITATGMSSSSVYRYFRSKDELIDAAAQESLSRTHRMLTALAERDSVPTPAETLELMLETPHRRRPGDVDLTKITVVAWGEAFRRPALRDFAHHFYAEVTSAFVTLARRWIDAGHLAAHTDPETVASLYVTLMPGLIVMNHLYELPTAESLTRGIIGVAPSFTRPAGDGQA